MSQNARIFFTLSISLVITLLVLRPIDNFDVWWHLNSGLWMLENSQVLDHDEWSFTRFNEPWLNISWLFQLIIAVFYKLGDVWGLFIFKALCVFFVFWLITLAVRPSTKLTPYVISFVVLFPTFYGHLHLRPHLFELLALATIILISQYKWDKWKALVGFFILLMWANSHASVAVGAIALALQILFGDWKNEIKIHARISISIVFLLTPLMTPYGIDIVNVLLVHGGSDFIQYYISEWLPHDSYPAGLWFAFIFICLLFLNKKISISFAELFLLIFFLYYSIKHQRFELEFTILLLRPLIESVGYSLNSLEKQNTSFPTLVSILILLVHCLIYSDHVKYLSPLKYSEAPYNRFKYPSTTISQLKLISEKLVRPLKVLNDYNYGGYISLFSKGSSKIYIDGRMSTVFPESFLLPSFESDPAILKQLVDRYQIDAILLNLSNAKTLFPIDPNWQLTGYDQASVLLVKRSILENMDLPKIYYNPNNYSNNFDAKDLALYIDSTKELLSFNTNNPVALNHLAFFSAKDTTIENADSMTFSYLDKSTRLHPNDIFSQATYAYLIAINDNKETMMGLFFKHLPPANKLIPGIDLTYDLAYARVLINRGASNLALDYLYPINKNRRYDIDKLLETWTLRIIAHAELNELNKAKNCLEIAYELISNNDEQQKNNLDNLGKILNSKIDN